MNKNCLTVLFAFALTAPANVSNAAVFERDLVPGSGDGLLMFDDVNNREWLDIPESLLANFPFGSLEERYQSVIAETLPGGEFDGFSAASLDDVIALAESAGIDISTTDFSTNSINTRHLIDLLGPTDVFPPNDVALTRALIGDLDPGCDCRLNINFAVGPSGAGLSTFSIADSSEDRPADITGVMLFRQVPEPSTCLMAFLGAVILFFGNHIRCIVPATVS